jgi:hypothetical protein
MLTLYKRRAILVACGLLAGALSCRSMQNEELRMRIEIDVYSGRPNPEFPLKRAAQPRAGSLLRIFLRPDVKRRNRVWVTVVSWLVKRGGSALPARLRVFDGLVINEDAQPPKTFVDSKGAEA